MKNNILKIALLQISPTKTFNGNLKKGIEYCKKAKNMGADIILFPEMWNTGYTFNDDKLQLHASATSKNGTFVTSFKKLAKKLSIAIGITFLEQHAPKPKNSMCIFDRFGQCVLHYSKVHTCDFGDERNIAAGEEFFVADLDTNIGNIKVGAMICYDREFPESARILMLKGAEIILVANACTMEINRISQLRARAFENMVGVATTNYPSSKSGCNGHSTAFDGIAYDVHSGDSRDTLIIEAGETEGIYIADFNIENLRQYRCMEVHGNAYRKPAKYSMLTNLHVEPPFIRLDKK